MTFIETLNSYFDFVDRFDKETVFYGIIGFMFVMFLWENFLEIRQYLVQVKNKQMPKELVSLTDQETFDKSRSYANDKSIYSIFHSFYGQIESNLILFLGAFPFVWNLCGNLLKSYAPEYFQNEIIQSNLFVLAFLTFGLITDLPWSYYHTFFIEEKHGFNKQTKDFFIKDTLKKFLLTVCLVVPILSLLIYIIRAGGDYFFIYAWLFVSLVSFVLILTYADYIAPLFDTFTPLEEGELKTRIEELAKSLNFPLYKLYVVEGSKRSAHSNAYMYGFYKSKRIVLFDTLIEGYKPKSAATKNPNQAQEVPEAEKLVAAEQPAEADKQAANNSNNKKKPKGCNNDEILAVLAHELGHWKLNHNLKNLVLTQLNTFFYFLIFAVLMNRQVLYDCLGFEHERPVIIGLLVILQYLFAPYNELLSFLMTVLSRRFEFQADEFAKCLGKSKYLKSSLIKLHVDNLSFPYSDPLYSSWHYSHPPLLERLRALEEHHNHNHGEVEHEKSH